MPSVSDIDLCPRMSFAAEACIGALSGLAYMSSSVSCQLTSPAVSSAYL